MNTVSEKNVCQNCIKEKYLTKHIKEHGNNGTCDYCGHNDMVCTIGEISMIIEDGFRYQYQLLDKKSLSERLSDDFVVHGRKNFKDTLDLLCQWAITRRRDLLTDLLECLQNQWWFDNQDYVITPGEQKRYTWYYATAMLASGDREVLTEPEYPLGPAVGVPPKDILENIYNLFRRFELYRSLPKGTIIYRGRASEDGMSYSPVSFGAPPPCHAKSNRFSKKGVSMFYSSEKPNTCIKELQSGKAIISTWELIEDLKILDLTGCFGWTPQGYVYSNMPSIFEKERRGCRDDYQFILDFATDISKPVEKNETVVDAYIPTQTVIEHLIKHEPDISGICTYSSYSSDKGERNYTLFLDNKDCIAGKKIKLLPCS